jgi:hypothetical protein
MASSWERLATVTLGSANNTIASGTITAKRYLRIEGYIIKSSSSTELTLRFNNDSGSNYARRKNSNGGSDGTDIGSTKLELIGGEATPSYFTMCIANIADREKLCITDVSRSATGAGTAPDRIENFSKWSNTSAQITQIDFLSVSSTFAADSIVTIWGTDDQGTTPFYPLIPNGAIFEESDTGKHYMFDGSQTWNEM